MKQATIVAILIILYFLIHSCNTTDPPEEKNGNGLDTTSHTINWLVEDIGEYGSILRDVAIINDTLIYAVGEIHRNDTMYNAAKWDGVEWELKRVYFHTVCGQPSLTAYPASSIFTFGDGQIWISSLGDKISILKNDEQINRFCLPMHLSMSINKIWGTSSNDLYVVGNEGNIAYYLNGNWQSIESGTNVNLGDVWGSPDGSVVWIAGFEDSYGTVLLRNLGSGFETVVEIIDPNILHPPDEITHVFKSLWADEADTVYLGAIGRVYAAPKNTTGYAKENIWWDYANQTEFPPETNVIRGTAGNDIFVAGYNQFVRHWNGASWKGYPEIEGDGIWRSMAVKDNLIIAVGENFSSPGSARIARGYRLK